jgi:serine/threonine protein kinase
VLGKGGKDRVRLAEVIETGERCVLKSGKVPGVQRERLRFLAIAGFSLVKRSSHLPKFLDFFETSSAMYAVWQLLACTLSHYVGQRGGKLTDPEAATALKGLLEALTVVHEIGMVHRDIKTENILLKDVDDLRTATLVDFGEALVKGTSSTIAAVEGSSSTDGLVRGVGTALYMSPAATKGDISSYADDIWGVGVVAHEILYGVNPFADATSLVDLASKVVSRPVQVPQGGSEGARRLLAWLLSPDPADRPTAAQALKDEWLQSSASQYLPRQFPISSEPGPTDRAEDGQLSKTFGFAITTNNVAGVSGAYVRFNADTGVLHLMDPRSGEWTRTSGGSYGSDTDDENSSTLTENGRE